jgi:hypothetical protein
MSRPDVQRSHDRAIVHRFATDGFTVIPGLFDATEIAEVRETLDELFSNFGRLPACHTYDLDHRPSDGQPGKIPAIRNTLRLQPRLGATRGIASAIAWSEHLMGSSAEVLWDAAIYKPSGSSSETPWHQDEAVYRLSGTRRPEWLVYFWVALDDVDAACAAIRFVPGSHKGPLRPHTWRDGVPDSSLEVVGAIEEREVATIPLGAGDATVHHPRTMHGSGANLSERCRKAWVLGVGRPRFPRWIRRIKRSLIG